METMSESPLTRPTLLLRVRDARDSDAWEQFIDIYTPLVTGYCRKLGLQSADASDVTQEVFSAVTLAVRNFEYDPSKGSFRSWLLRVTRNKIGHFFNKKKREPQGSGETAVHKFLEAQPSLEDSREWDRQYKRRLFDWAAEEIRPEFQGTTWDAFWRTTVERESSQTVADDLGMKVGAVYQAKSRVMARLRLRILEIEDDGSDGASSADS
jgi:RNA polymerase sigma factor (sigma-70 family)